MTYLTKKIINLFIIFLQPFTKPGKCLHYCSLLFILAIPVLLWRYPPTLPLPSKEVSISVLKKRSGEELHSFSGQQTSQFPKPHLNLRKGYIVSDHDASPETSDCTKMRPLPNSDCVVLLENLQNKCDISRRIRLAGTAGYEAIIFYNHSHIETNEMLTLKRDSKVSTFAVGDEEALELLPYTFPKSVRYNVLLKPKSDECLFQPFNEDPLFRYAMVFRTALWLLYIQGIIYGILLTSILRWCLVPEEYNICRLIYDWMYPYACLECHDATVSPFFKLILRICGKKGNVEKIAKQCYVDITKIIHSPQTTEVTRQDFQFESTLGCGSYGIVTQEIFLRTGERVAMKTVLAPYASLMEAGIMAMGNCCDGIVKLLYLFVSPTDVHFVMEYLTGSLREFMEDLLPFHCKIYTVELALALETLHSFNIGHRDLKPANIMLDANYHLKLGDFGIAHQFTSDNESVEEEAGTNLYWAPENYNHLWTLGSDWWAFGCIVFEMFSTPHQRFVDPYSYVEGRLKTGKFTPTTLRQRMNTYSITDIDVRNLLSKCLCVRKDSNGNIGRRYPFMKKPISSREEYMDVPIPVNRSVNILERVPFKTKVEFEYVPQNKARINGVMQSLNQRREQILSVVELKISDTYYFDSADINCYKENSLVGRYFVQN